MKTARSAERLQRCRTREAPLRPPPDRTVLIEFFGGFADP
jgi:hypothetical protein